MPRFIYISKTDEDNSDYNATFEALRARFGNKIAPLVVPIWDENKKVTGIIDVLNKRAYEMQDLKRVEIDIPEGKDAVIERVQQRPEGVRGRDQRGVHGQVLRRRGLHLRRDDPRPAPGRAGAVPVPRAVRLRRQLHGLPDAAWTTSWTCCPTPWRATITRPPPRRRDGALRGLPRRRARGLRVQDRLRPVRQVQLRQGPLRHPDAGPAHGQRPHRRREKLGRLYQHAGQEGRRRSRSSPAATSAPSARWRRSRPATPCATPERSSPWPPSPSPSPTTRWPSSPKTRGQEDKVAQGLNRMNEEDPSFRVDEQRRDPPDGHLRRRRHPGGCAGVAS